MSRQRVEDLLSDAQSEINALRAEGITSTHVQRALELIATAMREMSGVAQSPDETPTRRDSKTLSRVMQALNEGREASGLEPTVEVADDEKKL
jgi:hypothetical protein